MPSAPLREQTRQEVRRRANGCCEYCQCPESVSTSPFAVDHIFPRSAGGADHLDNLALACGGCNGAKYATVVARDPTTGETVPLFHPRRNDWAEHFAWSMDHTVLIGRTPTGRATISKLDLNRIGVVTQRRVLVRLGYLPPWQTIAEEATTQQRSDLSET